MQRIETMMADAITGILDGPQILFLVAFVFYGAFALSYILQLEQALRAYEEDIEDYREEVLFQREVAQESNEACSRMWEEKDTMRLHNWGLDEQNAELREENEELRRKLTEGWICRN